MKSILTPGIINENVINNVSTKINKLQDGKTMYYPHGWYSLQ